MPDCPHRWRVDEVPIEGRYGAVCKLCGASRSYELDPAPKSGPRQRGTRFTREDSLVANARRWGTRGGPPPLPDHRHSHRVPVDD